VKATASPTQDDGQQRRLVWSDEFDELDLNKWNRLILPAYRFNNERQSYTDSNKNSFIRNGKLVIKAQHEGSGYTSARLTTKNKAEWTYGRFEARAKLPIGEGSGTWPAIWMLPTDNAYGGWPNSGEIDIMEHVACKPTEVHATVHTGAYNHMIGTQRGAKKTLADVTDFHVYAVEWTADKVEGFVDDIKYFTFRRDGTSDSAKWPFKKDFHLILNVAVGGDWGGYCLNGKAPNLGSAGKEMVVDWVRVYEPLDDSSTGVDGSCEDAWDTVATDSAGSYTCGDRIEWLTTTDGGSFSLDEAKKRVASEFPSKCGACGRTCEDVWDHLATDSAGTFSCGSRIEWLTTADGGSLTLDDAKTRVATEFPGVCKPCDE